MTGPTDDRDGVDRAARGASRIEPSAEPPPHTAIGAPVVRGGEERRASWLPELDARDAGDVRSANAVLATMLPELARDEALRRRWVADVERMIELDVPSVARILYYGPGPDPRDPSAPPPWRVREVPPGVSLDVWLDAPAPRAVDEVFALARALFGALAEVHAAGAVLRQLHPQVISYDRAHGVTFTDVGLARVDTLSTRTARSLMIEGSPYLAPELLLGTVVDPRADLYSAAVVLWRALTGALPFGEAALVALDRAAVPALPARPFVPEPLAGVLRRCLELDPADRPESARFVLAILDDEDLLPAKPSWITCTACGARVLAGQRLCTTCGREAITLTLRGPGPRHDLVLKDVSEDADELRVLRELLEATSLDTVPPLNFLSGDRGLYSDAERTSRLALPTRLFRRLPADTAKVLVERFRAKGLDVVAIESPKRDLLERAGPTRVDATTALVVIGTIIGSISVALGLVAAGLPPGMMAPIAVGLMFPALFWLRRRVLPRSAIDLAPRTAPASLPASDPLVRRLAALLEAGTAPDVEREVGQLALITQHLVDRRAKSGPFSADLGAALAPVEALVTLVEQTVGAIDAVDRELASLDADEGELARALARSHARREPREARADALATLDHLRTLEERRARLLHQLLDAAALMRRAARLGLDDAEARAAHERDLEEARALLD
ncbi:protein kinase [Myxococcota bacterium]|nr:protein kinase [Myxococcota bacterium]